MGSYRKFKKKAMRMLEPSEIDESSIKYAEESFNVPITVHKVLQADTGEEAFLIESERGNWFILWSSGDISNFEKDEKECKEYFDSFNVEGELV